VGEKRSAEVLELLEAVHAATDAAVAAAQPGRTAEEVAAAAHETLAERGPQLDASPFVGHGIGLETVERPYLLPGMKEQLAENMVLCIEPKATLGDRFGCSIEQEVVVSAGGPRLITPTPTKLW
jgi:Xaa-Pro aminopeptidase